MVNYVSDGVVSFNSLYVTFHINQLILKCAYCLHLFLVLVFTRSSDT